MNRDLSGVKTMESLVLAMFSRQQKTKQSRCCFWISGFFFFPPLFLTLHFPAGWQVLTGSLYAAVCVKDLQSGQSRQLRGLQFHLFSY